MRLKMQNKKTLLQRLLVIYITFFIVLVIGIAHSVLPGFSKGYHEGSSIGQNILENYPRAVYLLPAISVKQQVEIPLEELGQSATVTASTHALDLKVEENRPDASPWRIAFGIIGGSPWHYAAVMLNALAYLAIIVLMFLIIHSLRKCIREERTLDKRNVWCIRAIGVLTILSELLRGFSAWGMSRRAAELLASSGFTVDTTFTISYGNLIMGILILFTAEVFAIGQNLSEEQKLTI